VMPRLAQKHRVIAVDLPGFGLSDKPTNESYSLRFFEEMLEGQLQQLGVEKTGLVVHDLGGPVGLYWASQRPERVTRLALLNTVVYPEVSLFTKAAFVALATPVSRDLMTLPWTLRQNIKIGMADSRRISAEDLEQYSAPFVSKDARRALARALTNVSTKGLQELTSYVQNLKIPVRLIYGRKDWALPDFLDTVERLRKDLPAMEITEFADCGHFFQEERPEELAALLAEFFEHES